ncbi:MAG: sensor histidine kinase [Gemmiger sp.]|nr:sensor histidine kinase [Gemmiger sp.]
MKFSDFLKDEIFSVLLQLVCAITLTIYLRALSLGTGECALILLGWFVVAALYYFYKYDRTNRILTEWESALQSLDKKYLLGEMLHNDGSYQLLRLIQILKGALKSMTENVSKAEQEKEEYQELLEKWTHELKAPLTAVLLLCENNPSDVTRKISLQAGRLAYNIEQILYYTRLGYLANDCLIKAVSLEDVLNTAILSNKQLLLQNHFSVQVQPAGYTVYTDAKLLGFILNQIINNSVQYKRSNPTLAVRAFETDHHVHLEIQDNGSGIKESDLGRVFDKGFTGSNGHRREFSTGIGLYLCKGLCKELGIAICIRSVVDEYTCVRLSFQKGAQRLP